jgi:hypothetical protein
MVAEKYAVAQDLDEIIGRYQQEKQRGNDPYAIYFPGSDGKKTRQPLYHCKNNPSPIVMSINPLSSDSPGFS